MDNDIEKIYKAFDYPSSVPKILKLVKAEGITATSMDTNIFEQTGGSSADQDYKTKKIR